MLDSLRKSLLRGLLEGYKSRKQARADTSLGHALAVTRSMLKRNKYCFLITQSEAPWPSARLVQPIVDSERDFILWFGTDPGLRKAAEIASKPRVTVAFEDRQQNANLVLYGTATLEQDLDTRSRRWLGVWRLFFPKGPKEEGYVVIRFEAERIELMNFSRNVIAEPFGLRPVVIERGPAGDWSLSAPKSERISG